MQYYVNNYSIIIRSGERERIDCCFAWFSWGLPKLATLLTFPALERIGLGLANECTVDIIFAFLLEIAVALSVAWCNFAAY